MLLKSLSIRGLHKTVSLDVEFNEDITLLVGINGSGKTSVLNAIDWLLKPNLPRLALAHYDSLKLTFAEKGEDYALLAEKASKRFTLSVVGPKAPLKPIVFDLRQIGLVSDEEEAEERLGSFTPEKHEFPTVDFLKSLSKPTVISLDRTISAESEEVHYVEARSPLLKRRTRARSPISHVQDVTSSKYAEYRMKAIANDDELKANIVISALQLPSILSEHKPGKPMTPEQLTQLEEKISTFLFATIKSPHVRKQVQQFFKGSRALAMRQLSASKQSGIFFLSIETQYRQVESLAKAFNEFETKNALAFKSLHEYLLSVNLFFNDSGKELFFDESTGRLAFTFLHPTETKTKKSGNSITHLSSGERQILVLFTFLAFASNPKSVFIVDEPELSLHPKWQSDFMDAFLKLRPEETQLLLATHSPDIVGKYKSRCVGLKGSRS